LTVSASRTDWVSCGNLPGRRIVCQAARADERSRNREKVDILVNNAGPRGESRPRITRSRHGTRCMNMKIARVYDQPTDRKAVDDSNKYGAIIHIARSQAYGGSTGEMQTKRLQYQQGASLLGSEFHARLGAVGRRYGITVNALAPGFFSPIKDGQKASSTWWAVRSWPKARRCGDSATG